MTDEKVIIALNSVTYAMKGAELLKKHGIKCRVTKLKSDKTKNGCTYGISTDKGNAETAARILKSGGVFYSEIVKG